MEGMAARRSVRKASGVLRKRGESSERKIAMPSAMGVEMRSASHRVPGRRLPEVEPELLDRQARIFVELEGDPADQEDDEKGKKPRPQAEQPIVGTPARGRGLPHGEFSFASGLELDFLQGFRLERDDFLRKGGVAEIGAVLLPVRQGPVHE